MASKVAITLACHSAVMPAGAEASPSASESGSGGMACTLMMKASSVELVPLGWKAVLLSISKHQPAMDSGQASDSVWCTPLANTKHIRRAKEAFKVLAIPETQEVLVHWVDLVRWEQLLRVPAAVTSALHRLQLA
eukprot:5657854-Prymnesium_polylepis.1